MPLYEFDSVLASCTNTLIVIACLSTLLTYSRHLDSVGRVMLTLLMIASTLKASENGFYYYKTVRGEWLTGGWAALAEIIRCLDYVTVVFGVYFVN